MLTFHSNWNHLFFDANSVNGIKYSRIDRASKIWGRQPLKNLKGISFQIFQRLSSTNLTWSTLEYFVPNVNYDVFLGYSVNDEKQLSRTTDTLIIRKIVDNGKIFTESILQERWKQVSFHLSSSTILKYIVSVNKQLE